jgi:hypothetical protein
MLQNLYSFAANCDLSCFSCDVSFWTTCNLYGFRCKLFRRVLWHLLFCSCSGDRLLHTVYKSMYSWELPGRAEGCLFHTASLSNCSYLLLMLLSSGGLTPYLFMLNSSNGFKFAYHNMVYALCCMVDIVLTAQNTCQSCCPYSWDAHTTCIGETELTITLQVSASLDMFSFLSCRCLESWHLCWYILYLMEWKMSFPILITKLPICINLSVCIF